MSWRRLLAVAYALLVEGLDSDARDEIDRQLEGGAASPRAVKEEIAWSLKAGGAVA